MIWLMHVIFCESQFRDYATNISDEDKYRKWKTNQQLWISTLANRVKEEEKNQILWRYNTNIKAKKLQRKLLWQQSNGKKEAKKINSKFRIWPTCSCCCTLAELTWSGIVFSLVLLVLTSLLLCCCFFCRIWILIVLLFDW